MKITIIGAGLGGLTFGALAARDGHEVAIYDKNQKEWRKAWKARR